MATNNVICTVERKLPVIPFLCDSDKELRDKKTTYNPYITSRYRTLNQAWKSDSEIVYHISEAQTQGLFPCKVETFLTASKLLETESKRNPTNTYIPEDSATQRERLHLLKGGELLEQVELLVRQTIHNPKRYNITYKEISDCILWLAHIDHSRANQLFLDVKSNSTFQNGHVSIFQTQRTLDGLKPSQQSVNQPNSLVFTTQEQRALHRFLPTYTYTCSNLGGKELFALDVSLSSEFTYIPSEFDEFHKLKSLVDKISQKQILPDSEQFIALHTCLKNIEGSISGKVNPYPEIGYFEATLMKIKAWLDNLSVKQS
ncbi:hypothetical protein D5018_08840 [Parashewanella curva]|uniref:Uncharacterized protein n=1 Tax=Parashewanella curva TaxID=2338552 RepID=A0A3L8Q005_9GAMM|nr:hypothetical protein [Parashewanella curva]RLV60113.1 hypothetical protein D5018_08840 [Parashewanella curva]